ncbi:acyltransferase family protein [Pseudomonas sp. UBA1879]|uniref:acyltransferase family protein n=1 Tax=Pseudomonas sp. UBA1879 TaxID=1947305 RepID=UPI0025E02771|nr:acyltransferase [Pseudomonas sp. UBA1879]
MSARMPDAFSVYLDLLRVVAAATVMVSHYPLTAGQAAITDRYNFGYDAVVVFFVLSGYVISHAVDTKERDGLTYSVNRIARIFPVAVIAVLLSWLLMSLGSRINPALYPDAFQLQTPLYYFSRTLSFTNEFWWDDIRPFGNGPYWSLSFEVWCYVIYGLAMFTRGHWRVGLVLLALVLTGPKQWLLLPIWLTGVAIYRCRDRFNLGRFPLWLMCVAPPVVFVALQLSNPRDWSYPLVGMHIERIFGHGLDGAANCGWGYLLAALVAVHLFAVRRMCLSTGFNANGRAATCIRQLASYTFSLYIFHFPLLIFWQAELGPTGDFYSPVLRGMVYLGTLIPVFILGYLVERRKKAFRKTMLAVFANAKRLMPP